MKYIVYRCIELNSYGYLYFLLTPFTSPISTHHVQENIELYLTIKFHIVNDKKWILSSNFIIRSYYKSPALFQLFFLAGFESGNKNRFVKNPSVARNIVRRRLKLFWVLWRVFVNLHREFMKHVIVISLILH